MIGFLLAALFVSQASDPIAVSVPNRAAPVSYAKEIADILTSKCLGCHNAAERKSKLSLEDIPSMLKGGKRGPALVPGKSDESHLFRFAAHRDKPAMPPVEKIEAKPLTPQELGLLQLWIEQGAKDDSSEYSETPPVLGDLPASLQPIVAIDMTEDGKRIAVGRGNRVQIYDADSGQRIVTLGGHQDLIQSLRLSPDGRYLAAGSYQIVTLWTCPVGNELKTFTGHTGAANCLAATRDGKMLISAGVDKTIRFWDAAAAKETRKLTVSDEVRSIAVSSDNSRIAAGCSDGLIRLFDLNGHSSGVLRGHSTAVQALAFAPDGRLLSASADGTARFWTLPPAAEFAVDSPMVLRGHSGEILAACVVPRGNSLATAGADGTLRFWDATDGRLMRSVLLEGAPPPSIKALACTADGVRMLAGLSDGRTLVILPETGQIERTLAAQPGAVTDIAVSPAGGQVVTVAEDGTIRCLEATSGQTILAFGHVSANKADTKLPAIRSVAFLPDGSFATASESGTLKTWFAQGRWGDWRMLGPHADRVVALDFNADGTLLAVGAGEPTRSGQVTIWETGKGLLIRRLENLHSDSVFGVRFSPDGWRLATASADKFVKIVNVFNGRELKSMEGHTNHVLAVDWNADGRQLVSASADGTLKFWDTESGEAVRTSNAIDKQFTAVRWPHGPGNAAVVTASGDQNVRFWNPGNSQITRTFRGPTDFVFGVAVSSDRARVAAGGADGVLFVWDGANGQVLKKLDPAGEPPRKP